jgi:hypothetical protein
MHVLQHRSDPLLGVESFQAFMRGVAVLTAVPGEPRKRVSTDVIEAILEDIYTNSWDDRMQVQFGLAVLLLYFTFSRAECPCPKNHSGPDSWDAGKHWQVGDFCLYKAVSAWVLWVRFKAIKQDPRIERPQARYADPHLPPDLHSGTAADSKDWVPIGDVPSIPHFSIALFYRRYVQLVGRSRAPEEPFFLDADGHRPFTYRALSSLFKQACLSHGGSERDALHGLRVAGYYDSKRANGLDLTVAHGGWSEHSDNHSRYDRFRHTQVLGVPAGMLGVDNVFSDPAGVRPIRSAPTHRGNTAASSHLFVDPDGSATSDDDDGAQAVSGLPPSYTREDRITATGRKYSVYTAPDGSRFQSMATCWRHFARSDVEAAAPPDSPSSSGHSMPSRSRCCNRRGPSGALCSMVSGHEGLCEWDSVPARRRAPPPAL